MSDSRISAYLSTDIGIDTATFSVDPTTDGSVPLPLELNLTGQVDIVEQRDGSKRRSLQVQVEDGAGGVDGKGGGVASFLERALKCTGFRQLPDVTAVEYHEASTPLKVGTGTREELLVVIRGARRGTHHADTWSLALKVVENTAKKTKKASIELSCTAPVHVSVDQLVAVFSEEAAAQLRRNAQIGVSLSRLRFMRSVVSNTQPAALAITMTHIETDVLKVYSLPASSSARQGAGSGTSHKQRTLIRLSISDCLAGLLDEAEAKAVDEGTDPVTAQKEQLDHEQLELLENIVAAQPEPWNAAVSPYAVLHLAKTAAVPILDSTDSDSTVLTAIQSLRKRQLREQHYATRASRQAQLAVRVSAVDVAATRAGVLYQTGDRLTTTEFGSYFSRISFEGMPEASAAASAVVTATGGDAAEPNVGSAAVSTFDEYDYSLPSQAELSFRGSCIAARSLVEQCTRLGTAVVPPATVELAVRTAERAIVERAASWNSELVARMTAPTRRDTAADAIRAARDAAAAKRKSHRDLPAVSAGGEKQLPGDAAGEGASGLTNAHPRLGRVAREMRAVVQHGALQAGAPSDDATLRRLLDTIDKVSM